MSEDVAITLQPPEKMKLLEQFRQQHQAFVTQRDQAQINLNQLIGAIFACDLMIKKLEVAEADAAPNLEDESNGKTDV